MIKLFLTDLDGCLTDGGYYVSESAQLSKRFYTRDFHGFSLLKERRIEVGIITTSTDAVVEKRRLHLEFGVDTFLGIHDKLKLVQEYYGGYPFDQICYIGDDVNDLLLLEAVGMAGCPSDAEQEVIDVVSRRSDGYVLKAKGGYGCVREMINIILGMQYNG